MYFLRIEASTSSHSRSFGQPWELRPLLVHLYREGLPLLGAAREPVTRKRRKNHFVTHFHSNCLFSFFIRTCQHFRRRASTSSGFTSHSVPTCRYAFYTTQGAPGCRRTEPPSKDGTANRPKTGGVNNIYSASHANGRGPPNLTELRSVAESHMAMHCEVG